MKKLLFIIPIALILIYVVGPQPQSPTFNTELPEIPASPRALEDFVALKEAEHKIKPGNEAEIVWFDPIAKKKTPIAVVYLHGFSASQHEGFPTHRAFADAFGCNLYLARLSDHGIDTSDAMLNFTVDRAWESAKEAYAIGKQLGDEVVVLSTSTGSTLALMLASEYPEIKGLINFSPNIAINDPAAFLLNNPWGLQIARMTLGGESRVVVCNEVYAKYWYPKYRIESLVELQEMIEFACTKARFSKVKSPVFNGVYYRDETHQDPIIRVDAVREMHAQLGGDPIKNVYLEFPTANDHVIPSDIKSNALSEALAAISSFAEDKLAMQRVPKPLSGLDTLATSNLKSCCSLPIKTK